MDYILLFAGIIFLIFLVKCSVEKFKAVSPDKDDYHTSTGFTVETLANDCATITKDLIRKYDKGENINELIKRSNDICKGQKNYITHKLYENKYKNWKNINIDEYDI